MATAMVRRRPHAERSGRFSSFLWRRRLPQFASAPRGTCNVRSLRCLLRQCARLSNESCNTLIFLYRFLHGADVPSGRSSTPTVHSHLGFMPGPSRAVDQVRVHKSLTRTLCVVQSEIFMLQSPQWRLRLCAPSQSGLLLPLPPSPDTEVFEPLQAPRAGIISDVSELSQANPQDVLEWE